MRKSIVDVAIKIAKLSPYKYKHGCVIFKGKRIISTGFNVHCRSVKSLKLDANRWRTSIHAEVSAILNSKRDLSGYNILIVRINDKNQLLMSKPCIYCYNYIKYAGINKIYYSVDYYPYIIELKD